nr:ribonuclease H-like domain-containing protein [Tanacetum cinerariifolium]
MDEALIPHAKRLRIGRSNFHLLSDIKSKESTLQLVYDVLRLTSFFKAFLVTADVPKIYMQEFWATTIIHHHSIQFKIDNKKHIVNLESFKEMLHICPRLPHQPFVEPPFKEEILAFLRFLRHSGAIKRLTDVNINKLHQPWRSFAVIINKFAIGATPPKPKASIQKTRSSSNTTITPPTAAAGPRLTTSEKGKQAAKASKANSLSALSEIKELVLYQGFSMYPLMSLRKRSLEILLMKKVMMMKERTVMVMMKEIMEMMDDEEEGSDDEQASDEEEFIHPSLSTHAEEEIRDEESFDPIPKTPENSDDEGNGEENLGTNVGGDEGQDEEDEANKLYRDVNINLESAYNDEFLKTIDENMQKIIKERVKEQVKRNLYKALVEAYEYDKIILDTYGDTVTLKRRHDDDADKDKEPSVGTDQGSKRRREGNEPESASAPKEKATMSGSCKSLVELEFLLEEVHKATTDQLDWVNPEGQQYPHNLLKPLPLIPNNRGRRVIPFDHFINNDLEYLRGGTSRHKYTTYVTKTKAADYGHIKWIEDLVPMTMWIQEPIGYDKHALWGISHWGRKRQQFYGFAINWEVAHDVYSKRRIIAVTELKIVEWHNYKYLDSKTVRRDDDKLYKFKEGDFKRLHIQFIKDMLLLLVQGKLTNLTVKERFAFNVSLRMFTRSIVIQRCMEDLQLGVKSYQKKLHLTRSDTYRSDLKRKEAYIANGTLTDVRTALDDHLKGIQMKYLPQSIWRKSDKDRVVTMIQAIDKRLKTRRIMRSLERFVGGRLDSKGEIIILPPISFEEHVAVQRETKARTLLLKSLLKDHMADFHHLDDAREIWLAVKARFGGNEVSKKIRKTMLKQAFLKFSVSKEEGLHKGYDRALPPSWSQVALTLKTRGDLEYLSFDDLYNKLRSLEIDVKGGSSYGSRRTTVAPTHSAFIGAASTKMVYSDQPSYSSLISYTPVPAGSIMEDVLHSFVAENKPTQQLAYEDFEQVDQLEREELDIKWQMAMLSLRINKFQKKAGRKINFNNKDSVYEKARMILKSVENGPLLWPTVEEDGVTRLKKYSELSAAEAIQADCDVKATNIILQGLPSEERECKLYDEFDKFAYRKGETLRDFYLRFSLLLNDMNMYNMQLKQFQVNTKFLNTLPLKWSKFVTDVKLVRDLHATNVDQLHAYLGQHEYHANEVRLMHERISDPLALVAQHQMNKSTYQQHQQSYHQHQFQPQAPTYQSSPYATRYHPPQYGSQAPSSSNLSTQLALEEKVRILSANLENTTNTLKYSKTLNAQANIEKQEWKVKFVESLASDKSSASETYDFASCVSSPKTNDSFYTIDVKILPKSDVKHPSPTNDNFPSVVLKATSVPAGSRNSSASTSAGRSIPAANKNRSATIHADRSIPAASRNRSTSIHDGRSIPAASRNRPASIHAGRHISASRSNKPTPFPAGRTVPTGWINHAARPFFRPTNLYFDNVYWRGIYNHMSMNEGRWGSAVHPHVNKDIGIVDSGCSRSMTGNKEKLADFVQVKGGTITFGGGDGKITGKGTIRTSKLDFENVYYVEELQNFNLFSVSQICDKKNKVLFTNAKCLVLTKEFQLPDESQVVLRIPRRHDLYTFNLSDIQPEQHINSLLAKASLEESTKWHRRMAHVNFKTINKLAKLRLVEGLPLKLFTNEHNCVACNKGKQHKAFYKAVSVVPNIRHLKPFGCQVTILNTSDQLGKFEGKANDGFLVGYAAHSLGQEWYFDLDYLTDSLGYTRFKTNPPAGTHDTNILADTQADDSDSECDEQFFRAPMENNLDYAEELARLQRQEYEAHSAVAKHGFEFSVDTAALLPQADIEIRRNLVPAAGEPTGSIVPTGGVLAGSDPAGSIVPIGRVLADSSVPASDVHAGSITASSVPAGGVLAGSLVSTVFGDPAASVFVPAVVPTDSAATS